jgi:hypothetical protein
MEGREKKVRLWNHQRGIKETNPNNNMDSRVSDM